jgi:hypothetical protein
LLDSSCALIIVSHALMLERVCAYVTLQERQVHVHSDSYTACYK